MNREFTRRVEQVQRRWWVVALVVAIALAASAVPALFAHPEYVGKSTLLLSSPDRAPEQDATMVVGYSTIFNEPETIARLSGSIGIPADVTFEAQPVAASPILSIQATAREPQLAQEAAAKMAQAFRDEVNAARQTSIDSSVSELQRQVDNLSAQQGADGSMNPLLPPLQEKLDTMRSDSTNKLQDLQPQAGVIEVKPSLLSNLALGAVGGLLLGILAALGLAAASTRVTSGPDLADKTNIEPLIELPSGGSQEAETSREDRVRTLANMVSLQDLPKSPVIALTGIGVNGQASELAAAYARLSAQQGYRTVLVHAANDPSQSNDGAGFNEALSNSNSAHSLLQTGELDSLKILSTGSDADDRYPRMTRERIAGVLDDLRADADTIIVVAPSIADTTVEAQLVCAAADLTILAVARGARSSAVTSASDALAKTPATLLGAVLVDGANHN